MKLSERSGNADDPFGGRHPTSHERLTGLPWDASYLDGPASPERCSTWAAGLARTLCTSPRWDCRFWALTWLRRHWRLPEGRPTTVASRLSLLRSSAFLRAIASAVSATSMPRT